MGDFAACLSAAMADHAAKQASREEKDATKAISKGKGRAGLLEEYKPLPTAPPLESFEADSQTVIIDSIGGAEHSIQLYNGSHMLLQRYI
jgi:hypothetical protein